MQPMKFGDHAPFTLHIATLFLHNVDMTMTLLLHPMTNHLLGP